ncbi:cyclic GMP-AMP synthase [Alosa sapidissima]|uniref:cyclic GMP-AMP synthase n=1 Tax=Alosa sapidissima TaxID=34773 RepID=UPI001C08701B|nr:cyclic GMP-AMP synthase [Alosa sapidissima]
MTDRKISPKCQMPRKKTEQKDAKSTDSQRTPTQAKSSTRTPGPKCDRGARGKSTVRSVMVGLPNPPAVSGKGAQRKSPEPKRPPGAAESPRGKSPPPLIRRGCSRDDDLSRGLQKTLGQLKISRDARSKAAKIKNEVVAKIKTHLEKSKNFKEIQPLPTGSYFENLKISNPDEFDVMFTTCVKRVDVQPFGSDGAYYSVKFKRHPQKHVLDDFLSKDDVLCASLMMTEFRREVKTAIKSIQIEGNLKMEPKKPKSPAVTLTLNVDKKEISIDIVLGIEVGGRWPLCAEDGMKIEKWLSKKVKQDLKFKPYYLVPKHEGSANKEEDGVLAKDVWRISFSHVEKFIMKNHGKEKTCCEEKGPKCCRKPCLKLLKHLLGELKAKHETELSKFCSYHAKTTLLHACTVRTQDSDWKLSNLHDCFQLLLQDFVAHLKQRELPNFFIPKHNLLGSVSAESCRKLADYIEKERNNGFPIFKMM